MHNKTVKIEDIIENSRAFGNFRKAVKQQDILDKFEEIFPQFNNNVKAIKINNNILFVKVENSVLRNELNQKKELMRKKINQCFKEEILIKDIKFI